MFQKNAKWFVVLALLLSLVLVACGDGDVQQQVEEAAQQVEEAAEELQPTLEAAAEEVQEVVEEVAPTVEAAAEEVQEAVEEAMEEPTEEPMEEEMADEPCAPAQDGPLAGIDPRGQTVIWWHNHSGSREELLRDIVADYNATNECGITVEALNQGGYNDIRNSVNASVAAGEVPAALVVGYQNDQAF